MNSSLLSRSVRAAVPALLLAVAAVSAPAELPQYTVTPLSTMNGMALNNTGEILIYGSGDQGGGVYRLAEAVSGVQTGSLTQAPPGWDGLALRKSTLTSDGSMILEVWKKTSGGGEVSEVAIGNLRTGQYQVLTGSPVNGDDDRNQIISPTGNFAALQGGPDRGQLEPYLYSSATGWQGLGNLVAGGDGRPFGVNSSGAVVGRTGIGNGDNVPFIWTAGAGMEAITDQGNAIYGEAMAINDAGFVTGTADGKAFVLNSGNMELTWLTPAADQSAVDINNAGQIIGTFWNPPFLGVPGDAAWVATAGDGFQPLENLIGQDLTNPEWRINEAFDINDVGWILANAYNYNDQRGYQVLLRPVPEPGAAALLAFGSLGFLRRRRASISSPSTA